MQQNTSNLYDYNIVIG